MQFKELPDVTYDFVGPIESKKWCCFPYCCILLHLESLKGSWKKLPLLSQIRQRIEIWSLLTVIPPDSVQVLQSDRRFLLCQSIIQCLSKLIQRIEREREENSDNLQITPFASLRIFLRLRLHHENVQMPFYVEFQLKRLNI